MKALWIAIAALVACIIAFIVVGSMMPSVWHVERTTVINAAPEAIFPWVNDIRRWQEWSPWNEQKDPTFKRSFGGPERGIGATMMWDGENLGRGRVGITSSIPYEKVSYDLFLDDSMTPSKGAVALVPQATGTIVTWTDDGDMGANLFGRFALDDIDATLGPDLEMGLSNLKSKVETAAPVAAAQPDADPNNGAQERTDGVKKAAPQSAHGDADAPESGGEDTGDVE